MSEHVTALFLGTYPPRQCGIATFTADVVRSAYCFAGTQSDVIAIDDAPDADYLYSKRVVWRLQQHDRDSYRRTATFINGHNAAALNIQHEYGIFGGAGGEWVLDLVDAVHKPIVLTLHTVVPNPEQPHRTLARRLCAAVERVVVLSETARQLLVTQYAVAADHITVIPHGIPDVPFVNTAGAKKRLGLADRFVISTFGLLSRGKGLETAIDALSQIVHGRPDVLYVILGATHPSVRRREGETYRNELHKRISQLGIERNVLMLDRYLALSDLLAYLAATDVYVTPYVNEAQVVSGTLAYALGAGKPVVSTPYLYARELLAENRGVLVPFQHPEAMAMAFRLLTTGNRYRAFLAERAYALSRHMTWANVGRQYAQLLASLSTEEREPPLLVSAD